MQKSSLLIELMSPGDKWRLVEREHTKRGFSPSQFTEVEVNFPTLPDARSRFDALKTLTVKASDASPRPV